jgi:hypothetical protein
MAEKEIWNEMCEPCVFFSERGCGKVSILKAVEVISERIALGRCEEARIRLTEDERFEGNDAGRELRGRRWFWMAHTEPTMTHENWQKMTEAPRKNVSKSDKKGLWTKRKRKSE